jgi:hypothetical protein
MAWISQMKVVESRTVKGEEQNGRAEREFTVDFLPGELKADDKESIQMWCKQMSEACKCSIDESMPFNAGPRKPESQPESEKKDGPATEKQIKYIKDLINKKHDPPEIMAALKEEYEIKELKELTFGQASGVIERLKEKK